MARRRKITSIQNPTNQEKVATIYRDPDAGEFVVVLKGRPAADYFTSDREDAEGTAKRMVLEGTSSRRRMAKRSKLGAAARACKGKKKGAFRVCVRKHMKKRRR
jgi:hypothetical protein